MLVGPLHRSGEPTQVLFVYPKVLALNQVGPAGSDTYRWRPLYAQIDFETKVEALATCEIVNVSAPRRTGEISRR
jgi:hypothetical protein